ncbi:SitI3 family protein [Couchioplanes caeruleus]|uniref:SitI3 family protein n=1 Tax=Couchioplanes caeruleus TaxID=56438 RepID=UPI0020BED12F|nr:SitI3 family protein [Couchioplanes caeruleus]UQU63950.1 SitI3 family protein [Couchioplanes caeruleus]
MALDYRLTLAGTTPVDQVAERAYPDPDERPTGTPPLLSADLLERLGFSTTVRAGRNGYVDVLSDDGSWEWEPEEYVNLGFRMDKFADPQWNISNMLTVVRRVLTSGSEDAAFVFNGDVLLLTRLGGELVKHRRDGWWSSYAGADDIIPG